MKQGKSYSSKLGIGTSIREWICTDMEQGIGTNIKQGIVTSIE